MEDYSTTAMTTMTTMTTMMMQLLMAATKTIMKINM
jgi:hypothetical protein